MPGFAGVGHSGTATADRRKIIMARRSRAGSCGGK
jgi:hypothetical protein